MNCQELFNYELLTLIFGLEALGLKAWSQNVLR